jgi:16S rRNA (guanine527-N7)-methyltransferase
MAEQYAHMLATAGVERGLIGPREVARLWERHVLNCAVLGESLAAEADVCDIGSGAGLPGLVLAISRPDLSVTLVEPLLRRSTFLSEVVADLALPNVEVVRARAEELHGKREFSVVTSRAVAPLERLVGWSLPLVRRGGLLVAMKGASAHAEIEAAEKALRRHGAGRVSVEEYGVGVVDPPTTAVVVEATAPSRLAADRSGKGRTRGRRR